MPAPSSQRVARAIERSARRIPLVSGLARRPAVVRAGYLIATAAGLAWGAALSTGRMESRGGIVLARGCPKWAFGRGGTTVGAVYLTDSTVSPDVLEHEAVHREQWRRYGLAFVILYVAAGPTASENRFEVEAGLARGGYR